MKDAYSFDADLAGLDKSYKAMYDAYCRIFKRCGLDYVIVEAEVGEMGGSGSHQFTVPCESGEDTIVYTEDNSTQQISNGQPSIRFLTQCHSERANRVRESPPMQEVHTPNIGSIEKVCAFLKTKPEQMIKTLIYSTHTGEDIRKEIDEYSAKHAGQRVITSESNRCWTLCCSCTRGS